LGDEHNPRLAATVFEFQRLEASNRAAAAVCPCGPMARATDPNTTLRVSGIRARTFHTASGTKTRYRVQGRATALGRDKRPSLGRPPMGETRRKRSLGGNAKLLVSDP